MDSVALEHAVAGRPMPGYTRSGDRAVFAPFDGGTVVAVIDGLGHGPEAADAADAAASALGAAAAGTSPVRLLEACHAALRRLRGAAVSVAVVASSGGLEWLSVGNVTAAIVTRSPRTVTRLPNRGGIVGLRLPRLVPLRTAFDAGDVLVVFTDGIHERALDDVRPGRDPKDLATILLDRHAVANDDALVLVARTRSAP